MSAVGVGHCGSKVSSGHRQVHGCKSRKCIQETDAEGEGEGARWCIGLIVFVTVLLQAACA
jgi:hypothetical protein